MSEEPEPAWASAARATAEPGGAARQSVDRLGPSLGGRWLVITQGSEHVWDLEAMTYQRLPGPDSHQFDHDREIVSITRVGAWPAVGAVSLVFYDDPARPDTHEQWRRSSRIRTIRRLPGSA